MPPKVIIGLPEWYIGGPCIFAERLVRGLTAISWDARVLLTEANSIHIAEEPAPALHPDDIRVERLPAGRYDSWGMRWDALVRYLEERAPCIYLMLHDWRNNVVAPRLSDRVALVGLVQADNELEYNQALRLGHYWNAIVAASDIIHLSLAYRAPHLSPRLVTIRSAVPVLGHIPEKASNGPLRLAYSGELRFDQKRLGDLIQIAYGLDATKTPFELTVIGDGPMRAELEAQAQPLMARGQVRFLGRLANSQLLNELENYDAFVQTSDFAGHSISLLEAMSRGCIPVVSELATQSLLIEDGVNACCAPIGAIDVYVDRLAALANDPTRRLQMAQAAFQTIIDGGYRVEDMLASYLALFEKIDEMSLRRRFVRHRGWMVAPPQYVGNVCILPIDSYPDRAFVSENTFWPNSPQSTPDVAVDNRSTQGTAPSCLKEYKVIVAIPYAQISGVDVFATHLVRHLRQRGIETKIVGGRRLNHTLGLALADDIPVEAPFVLEDATWPMRWEAMIAYLEAQAPCIYIPNCDYDYSGISPRLSDRIKVISIAHSDDPVHYEHVLRLRGASNAIVGVSGAIVRHIEGLDPTLKPRLHTIPYGIELPPPPDRDIAPISPLRIVYAGRLMNYQKRVQDLVHVALALEKRQIPFELTIIGDGPERESLQSLGRKLILKRCIWMPGKLNNDEVLEILRDNDVFLLPSTFEGLSVGLLEAMSCGLVPVVSNMRSGVPELIRDGENGFIVGIGDIEGYADRLTGLYRNPERRQCMARAAYDTICADGYRVEDMIGRYIDLFETVITEPFARPAGPVLPPDYMRCHLNWKVQAKYNIKHPRYFLQKLLRKQS